MPKPTAVSVIEGALAIITPTQAWCMGELHEQGYAGHPDEPDRPVAHCAIGSIDMVTNKSKVVTVTDRAYDYDSKQEVEYKNCYVYDVGTKATYVKARRAALEFLGEEARKVLSKNGVDEYNDYEAHLLNSGLPDSPERRQEWNEASVIKMNDHRAIGSQKSVVAMFKRALKKAQKEASNV